MAEIIGKRYELLKLIGKGGMAEVYLAYDKILNREVAVKILKDEMADDSLSLERFKREAGATTTLSHPNIVDVYDVGDDLDKHYIVMEYVKGYTLKQLIKKRGYIPYKEAVWIMKQLCGALMEAHRNGIIHRDVKSQNVLIKDDGTIKVADFGIALASGAMSITKEETIIGSVHYLAPEITKGEQASMSSDIYALGIVFYEMLTGSFPFNGENAAQIALMHLKQEIKSVREFDPKIPQSVDNIIIKATAKAKENRYSNVALMLKDLNDCLKQEHLNDEKISLDQKLEDETSLMKKPKIVEEDKKKKKKNKSNLFNVVFLLSISLLSIALLIMVLFLSGLIGKKDTTVEVPDLYKLTLQEARDTLGELGLDIDDSRIIWSITEDVDKDLIYDFSPIKGSKLEKGSKIRVYISLGKYETLKDYVSSDYLDAKKDLESLNFIVKLIPVESDKDDPGKVIEQSLERGYKYDPSITNEITLKYIVKSDVILPLDLKGASLEKAETYFDQYDFKYKFELKDISFFSEEELLNSKPNTLIRTSPELGCIYSQTGDNQIIIYYYEGEYKP